jgi:hypothetical protein
MIRLGEMATQRGSYTMLCYRMEQLEIFDLRVVLRAHGDATDVTIFGDLRSGVGRNLRWARVSSVVLGAIGGACTLTVGLGMAPLLAVGLVVAGGAAGAGASLGAADHMRVQLERLLDEIARTLQRATLMLPAGPGADVAPGAGVGDDGTALRIVVPPR